MVHEWAMTVEEGSEYLVYSANMSSPDLSPNDTRDGVE